MSFATIDDLRSQLGTTASSAVSMAYAKKMLHTVPDAPVVDRAAFILEHCRGKRVVEFGASGPMHEAIVQVAARTSGVDREVSAGVVAFDLDDVSHEVLPSDLDNVDIIVCGEVLEHLSNPGHFLTRLKRQWPTTPVIITVPNAFSAIAAKHVERGVENVNRDHVAWYSYRTLFTLLERHGYARNVFAWYHGHAGTAEGLIVMTE